MGFYMIWGLCDLDVQVHCKMNFNLYKSVFLIFNFNILIVVA